MIKNLTNSEALNVAGSKYACYCKFPGGNVEFTPWDKAPISLSAYAEICGFSCCSRNAEEGISIHNINNQKLHRGDIFTCIDGLALVIQEDAILSDSNY